MRAHLYTLYTIDAALSSTAHVRRCTQVGKTGAGGPSRSFPTQIYRLVIGVLRAVFPPIAPSEEEAIEAAFGATKEPR